MGAGNCPLLFNWLYNPAFLWQFSILFAATPLKNPEQINLKVKKAKLIICLLVRSITHVKLNQ